MLKHCRLAIEEFKTLVPKNDTQIQHRLQQLFHTYIQASNMRSNTLSSPTPPSIQGGTQNHTTTSTTATTTTATTTSGWQKAMHNNGNHNNYMGTAATTATTTTIISTADNESNTTTNNNNNNVNDTNNGGKYMNHHLEKIIFEIPPQIRGDIREKLGIKMVSNQTNNMDSSITTPSYIYFICLLIFLRASFN